MREKESPLPRLVLVMILTSSFRASGIVSSMDWSSTTICAERRVAIQISLGVLIYPSCLRILLFRLESKMFLSHVAERDHDDGGQHFGDGGIDMKLLYEELDKYVVQQEADQHQDEITE